MSWAKQIIQKQQALLAQLPDLRDWTQEVQVALFNDYSLYIPPSVSNPLLQGKFESAQEFAAAVELANTEKIRKERTREEATKQAGSAFNRSDWRLLIGGHSGPGNKSLKSRGRKRDDSQKER